MELDHNKHVPLHIQLKDLLEEQVLQGHYKEKIPSERELMDRFSVSRSTVREAVSFLVHEGILEKRHGKGTFVSRKPVEEWLKITNFTETIKELDIKLLDHGIISTPENIGEATELEEQCYFIERLRLKSNTPIAIERHYYPLEIGSKLETYDLDSVILYDTLEKDFNINFWEGEQIITCEPVSKENAAHLSIPDSMWLLITERIISDKDNHFEEYYKGFFRPDMYSFAMKMSRKTN